MDFQYKKINKEYDQLNKNYSLCRKDIAALQASIDEEKAKNYNLNQELNNTKKALQKSYSTNDNNTQQTLMNKPVYNNIQQTQYNTNNSNNTNNQNLRTMYNANIKNNYNNAVPIISTTLNINEYSNDNNNNECVSLETELASKLREIQLIENELRKIPDKPRTINEIKIKKEKNERLALLEDTVSKLRQKLRQLNK